MKAPVPHTLSPSTDAATTAVVTGLHHLTAIATDPQQNIDFYAGLLGLRLVKKTVNFDDPSAYHLYYGDGLGSPGTIITFFYWPAASRGRVGSGQVAGISLAVPATALDFWQARLERHGVSVTRTKTFGEDVLALQDPDGIPIELVAVPADGRTGWSGSGVPAEHAVRGMHTVRLAVREALATETLLTTDMEWRLVKREGNRARFEAGPGGSGRFADVVVDAALPRGLGGAGTVHHIAFRVADDAPQRDMQSRLLEAGYHVSDVRDRQYFHSIYYRERNGILFEIATDAPGFAVDEQPETLGTALKLPAQFEHARSQIEELLPALNPARRYA